MMVEASCCEGWFDLDEQEIWGSVAATWWEKVAGVIEGRCKFYLDGDEVFLDYMEYEDRESYDYLEADDEEYDTREVQFPCPSCGTTITIGDLRVLSEEELEEHEDEAEAEAELDPLEQLFAELVARKE